MSIFFITPASKYLTVVIPAPYQVRDKLQPESDLLLFWNSGDIQLSNVHPEIKYFRMEPSAAGYRQPA